ncbi:MAG: transketolase [Clostridiaceae bacterium]|nr:transketolase [Clostridiaceae bacterium]
MDTRKELALKFFASQIRLETFRQVANLGFGHLPGSLSVADLLAVLYGSKMNIRPEEPNWPERDIMVMSKGHAGPAVYSTLALKGYFPMSWLSTLNKPGTRLPSHCDRLLTPGVDMTAGSLGQGISAGLGLALAQKVKGIDAKTYIIVGDGECNEGEVWEAFLFAPQRKLDNVIVFIDRNLKQLDGTTAEVLALGDMAAKLEAFGWHTQTINGQDVLAISEAIDAAHTVKDRPSAIVMNTIKGAGVKELEEMEINHHIRLSPDMSERGMKVLEEAHAALAEVLRENNITPIPTALDRE